MSKATDDLIQTITQNIIDTIESAQGQLNGSVNWTKVLNSDALPTNHDTQVLYSGINVLILWDAKFKKQFTTSRWLTYKQAQKLGLQVRKGEVGTRILKYGTFVPKVDPNLPVIASQSDEEAEEKTRGYLQVYTVFNLCQVEGIDIKQYEPPEEHIAEEIHSQACARAKFIFDHCGAKVNLGHNSAFYRPGDDAIYMPALSQFSQPEDFYAVFFHELTHWTGSKERLNRDKNYRQLQGRAYEELIAELGSAFICADVDILSEQSSINHASYIQSWLQALKDDPKMIVSAASKASKAFAYIQEQVKSIAKAETQSKAA